MVQEIPCIFYLYVHSKIFERTRGNPINVKEVKQYLFQWKIPMKIRPLIIKEMEILGLFTRNRHTLEIKRPCFDIENCNNYYRKLGLFKK